MRAWIPTANQFVPYRTGTPCHSLPALRARLHRRRLGPSPHCLHRVRVRLGLPSHFHNFFGQELLHVPERSQQSSHCTKTCTLSFSMPTSLIQTKPRFSLRNTITLDSRRRRPTLDNGPGSNGVNGQMEEESDGHLYNRTPLWDEKKKNAVEKVQNTGPQPQGYSPRYVSVVFQRCCCCRGQAQKRGPSANKPNFCLGLSYLFISFCKKWRDTR